MNEKKRGSFRLIVGAIASGFVTVLGSIWLIMMLVRGDYKFAIPAVLLLIIGVLTLGISIYFINRRD